MFDQFLNTQTTNSGTIQATVSAYDVKAIFIGNVSADTVRVEVIDNYSALVIEDVTYSLLNEPTNWKDYFYNPFTYQKNSVIHERTTLQRDTSVRVTSIVTGKQIGRAHV